MPGFRTYNRIAGISDQRRLPRVGKIRLGVKRRTDKGKEYPSEVSYFVVRDEDYAHRPDVLESFRKRYGDKPTELDIMFPVPDELTFFPQAYKKYGGGGLRCKGDGVNYTRVDKDTGEITEGACPSPEACDFAVDAQGRTVCKRVASLVIMLPTVTLGGVFQIDTTSFHSTVDINSGIDYCRAIAGRIDMIPLKLRREPRETMFGGKKATHYCLTVALPDSKEEILRQGRLITGVRSMFASIGGAAPVQRIEAPSDEVPEDLYPKDVVRDAQTRPTTPPPEEPPTEPEPEAPPCEEEPPPPAEPKTPPATVPPSAEPPQACIDCQSALGPRAKRFKVGESGSGDDLVVCLKCHRKREKGNPPAEPEPAKVPPAATDEFDF
jgi:recombination directionality factor gp3-like protein